MKNRGVVIAAVILLAASCQRAEVTDRNGPDNNTGELHFRPSLGEAYISRAGESDNSVLQEASAAGVKAPHIVIETYTGTPASSLNRYFSDELGYFKLGNYWDVNSETKRFLPTGGMNLYAYFATDFANKGDLSPVEYIHPATEADHPQLKFTVDTNDALNQVDLIAAKVEGITRPDVTIPMQHILSQINFGVIGIEQHQITVKNIRVNQVMGVGTFDYRTWQWTLDTKAATHTYPYYFPDRKKGVAGSGLGDNYKTQGALDDFKNSYLFGDGGMFGPGEDPTFLYAQVTPGYATKEHTTTPLHNALMLLPQEIKKNADATVTFDYEIEIDGLVIRSAANNVVHLDAYYDWKPNFRYVYLFKFDDPQKVTFEVLVQPWKNYNGGDGIVETDELTSANLFQQHVRPIQPSGAYSVPLGPLTSDFLCDWSLFTLDNSFTAGQSFTLKFENELSFKDGKSVIINPPFGFTASVASLKAPGVVQFTAGPYSYYSTSAALQSAIGSGGGNYEFSVSEAVKLDEITFTGSTTAESSLALHFPRQYGDVLPPKWQLSSGVAVYFPNDYALTGATAPYSYTIYTVPGLQAVLDWMNNGGINPGGSISTPDVTTRMQTNINLAKIGRYDLAEVYKSATNADKPAYIPIGSVEATPYTGTFNGNGATISNLYIDDFSVVSTRPGLFGWLGWPSHVKFVNLENVYIYSGQGAAGGVAGRSNSGATITGCSVSGTIHGGFTGGIVGDNAGLVYSCASSASVTTYSQGNNGGIAGANTNTIQGCYSVNNDINITGQTKGITGTNVYVAPADVGTNSGAIRVSSIAALNGKIPQLNSQGAALWTGAHFVSGTLNATPPTIATGDPAGRLGGGVLKGTFIQNWFALYWDQDKWNEEMAILATIGMEYLVIDQVMEFSDYMGNLQYMSWYNAEQSVLVNDPSLFINANPYALEYCMNACRTHGIKLFIGTFFDKRYWNDGAAVTQPDKWYNCITTVTHVMNDLTTKYFHGGANNYNDVLAGWYFPYEVDDFYFQTPQAKAILTTGITQAMTHRNRLNPDVKKPYLFSPFMNGNGPKAIGNTMNAAQYAALWGEIMNTTGFQTGDILSPQDCIGTGKLTLTDLATWMPALKGAVPTGVEFWINVETFGPGGDALFLTGQQIPASNPYAAKLISFSYPIYYSPDSDSKQGDHKAYKRYYDAQ